MTPTDTASARESDVDRMVADMDGPVALPRSNGELVFEEPWQGRAFAAAIALSDGEAIDWEAFRQSLISEIGAWESERDEGDSDGWSYYERWLAALERLLLKRGILDREEIEARIERVAHEAAHEHDHDHDHEEDG